MDSKPCFKKEDAFTLVEVMVSASVMMLLMAIIFGLISKVLNLTEKTDRKLNLRSEVRRALNLLEEDLESMALFPQECDLFSNAEDTLFFLSYPRSDPGIAAIWYSLEEDENGQKHLYRSVMGAKKIADYLASFYTQQDTEKIDLSHASKIAHFSHEKTILNTQMTQIQDLTRQTCFTERIKKDLVMRNIQSFKCECFSSYVDVEMVSNDSKGQKKPKNRDYTENEVHFQRRIHIQSKDLFRHSS